MTIKYLTSYSGPGYTSMDQEFMDGFTGLYGIMQSMRNRQNGEDWVHTYGENLEGVYQPQNSGGWSAEYTLFPATTRDDVMWVYWAIPDNAVVEDGYLLGDLAYCITVGPRGGIRVEKA